VTRAVAAAALAALAACAGPRAARAPPPDPGPPAAFEEGVASYYGRAHHGRRTASGERFDMLAMTCAHREHAFGTRLRVTDLATGRSVVVRVNDRGPFARGRVVDLSLAAARELGIVERGVARVRVERLDG
jgi:rare lipoprotein A